VTLPEGWLKDREMSDEWREMIAQAELSVSGG